MQITIKSPDGKLYPSDCNTLQAGSFNSLPPSWRWSVGITDVDGNYTELRAGNGAMTTDQWDAWTTQPSDNYVMSCVAASLGLTPAQDLPAPKQGDKKSAAVI